MNPKPVRLVSQVSDAGLNSFDLYASFVVLRPCSVGAPVASEGKKVSVVTKDMLSPCCIEYGGEYRDLYLRIHILLKPQQYCNMIALNPLTTHIKDLILLF